MRDLLEPIAKVVAYLSKLPGVGEKTASKYAYTILNMSEEDVENFAQSIVELKEKVFFCKICGNYTDIEVCNICTDRDSEIICVVKEPKDVNAFERTKDFKGVYHVLHGTINPMLGIGPDQIRIKELIGRLDGVKEVIMATNSDVEGEATAVYVSRLLKPLGIRVSRLAHGIPIGGDITYTDELTLSRAMQDRKEY